MSLSRWHVAEWHHLQAASLAPNLRNGYNGWRIGRRVGGWVCCFEWCQNVSKYVSNIETTSHILDKAVTSSICQRNQRSNSNCIATGCRQTVLQQGRAHHLSLSVTARVQLCPPAVLSCWLSCLGLGNCFDVLRKLVRTSVGAATRAKTARSLLSHRLQGKKKSKGNLVKQERSGPPMNYASMPHQPYLYSYDLTDLLILCWRLWRLQPYQPSSVHIRSYDESYDSSYTLW